MKIIIDISEEQYEIIKELAKKQNSFYPEADSAEKIIANGTPLPKEHSFIAICNSDFPITEEVKQDLKNTVFVGDEDCRYCFDMTEIISR